MNNFNGKIELQKSQKMADEIADIVNLDLSVYDALAKTPRSNFTPKGMLLHAYKLDALPLAASQWLSSPLSVAKMTMALDLANVDKVLEIGCGSGYQAAILSKIVRRVFSIERIEKLAISAKQRFKDLQIHNVNIRFDDGNLGWRAYAPYERILFSAATKEIPKSLLTQLEIGGILVAPIIKNNSQFIVKFTKENNEQITETTLEECKFIEVLKGVEKA